MLGDIRYERPCATCENSSCKLGKHLCFKDKFGAQAVASWQLGRKSHFADISCKKCFGCGGYRLDDDLTAYIQHKNDNRLFRFKEFLLNHAAQVFIVALCVLVFCLFWSTYGR
jgi:hypothetical protein